MHYLNVALEDDLWDALRRAKQESGCRSWGEFFAMMLEKSGGKKNIRA